MKDKIRKEIENLFIEGAKIIKCFIEDENDKDKYINQQNYQIWYTRASLVIRDLLPSRIKEFTKCYIIDKRTNISAANYTISDYFRNITINRGSILMFDPKQVALAHMTTQLDIIQSLSKNIDNVLFNLKSNIEFEVMDNEIESARVLLKEKFIRSAGAICGVVLERHFSTLVKNHNLIISKKNPCINDYNDLFKAENIYDNTTWRHIQYLADIRNLCDHDKDRNPTKEEVEELINGVDKIIKTIF